MEYDGGELMHIHPFALGIEAASFAERSGKWDSGTGIWDFGDFFERGEMKRSKDIAESPARSERPKKIEN